MEFWGAHGFIDLASFKAVQTYVRISSLVNSVPYEPQTEKVRIRGHEITLREVSYATLMTYRDKISLDGKLDPGLTAIYGVCSAIDPATWPKEDWGELNPENLGKLGFGIVTRLITTYNRLNSVSEEKQDFLKKESSSKRKKPSSSRQSASAAKQNNSSAQTSHSTTFSSFPSVSQTS